MSKGLNLIINVAVFGDLAKSVYGMGDLLQWINLSERTHIERGSQYYKNGGKMATQKFLVAISFVLVAILLVLTGSIQALAMVNSETFIVPDTSGLVPFLELENELSPVVNTSLLTQTFIVNINAPIGFEEADGTLDVRPSQLLATPKFLTLPFSNVGVQITQGWVCHFGSAICGLYTPYGAHHAIDYARFSGGSAISFDLLATAPGNATCYPQSTHPVLTWHYGNIVQINHTGEGAGYSSIYAHLANCEFTSRFVQRGERIGAAGTSGQSTGIHLHFELRNSAFTRVDPYDLWTTIYSYPQPGASSPLAGTNHYWTTNPPSYFSPTPITPPSSTDCLKPLLRYWNENLTGHFYTSRWEELGPGQGGWVYERFEGYVAAKQDCFVSNTLPLYRFWHPDRQKHFYTTSASEKATVEQQGFVYEGITGYVLREANSLYHTLPLYRCYSSQHDNHFYTTRWSEVQNAVNNYGYIYERIEAHVFGAEALNFNPSKVYLPLVMR